MSRKKLKNAPGDHAAIAAARAARGRSEAEILAGIMGYLGTRGDVMFWRQNTGGYSPSPGRFVRFGAKGGADILAVWRGKFVAIEVKREGKYPSPDQRRWGEQVEAHGGIYIVARSVPDVASIFGVTILFER